MHQPNPAISAPRLPVEEGIIANAYGRLEECGDQVRKREHLDDLVLEKLLQTLADIAGGAVTVALEGTDVSVMEQAQILDILASVTSLAEPLRHDTLRRAGIQRG